MNNHNHLIQVLLLVFPIRFYTSQFSLDIMFANY